MFNLVFNVDENSKWKRFIQSSYVFGIFSIIYIPLIVVVFMSFNEISDRGNISIQFQNNWNGVKNFISFFTDKQFVGTMPSSLLNSLLVALITVPISIVIGLITLISVWKSFGRSKKFVFFFSNLSVGTPDIIQGITFSILFSVLFLPMGINLGFFTVLMSHIALSIPYVIISIYPKLSKVKYNTLLASYDLNYNFFETVWKIIIPTLLPNICVAALIVFSLSFDDFIITNLVRGNFNTITNELYTMHKGIKAWSIVFGALVIVACFIFSLIFATYKSIVNKRDE